MEVDEVSDAEELLKIFKDVRTKMKLADVKITADKLLKHIKTSALPFLRCSSLFFHYLTSVPAPLKLFDQNNAEFDVLSAYLDLTNHLSSIFTNSPNLTDILTNLCHSFDVDSTDSGSSNQQLHQQFIFMRYTQQTQQQPSEKLATTSSELECTANSTSTASSPLPNSPLSSALIMEFPRKPNTLLELPTHYSQLINQFSMFTCPKFNSVDESRSPAMCLVCGCIVCSQSYCCQVRLDNRVVGAAMAHSYECGAGSGIFIRVRDCQVMMLHGMTRGCFISPPYLDEHGETDEGLRRGNPLYLCDDRYKQLQRLWLNHSIPEEIVHKLEFVPNFSLTYDWQHF